MLQQSRVDFDMLVILLLRTPPSCVFPGRAVLLTRCRH